MNTRKPETLLFFPDYGENNKMSAEDETFVGERRMRRELQEAINAPRLVPRAISARLSGDAAPPPKTSPPTTDADNVRHALNTLLSSPTALHDHATPADRLRLVHAATCRDPMRAVHANPQGSLIATAAVAVAVGALVATLLSSSSAQSSPAPSSTSCRRAVDRMLHYA